MFLSLFRISGFLHKNLAYLRKNLFHSIGPGLVVTAKGSHPRGRGFKVSWGLCYKAKYSVYVYGK